jgi:type IV secretory pathway protease TraF
MPPSPLANFLSSRGYLASGVPLIKRVLATTGQTVCDTASPSRWTASTANDRRRSRTKRSGDRPAITPALKTIKPRYGAWVGATEGHSS